MKYLLLLFVCSTAFAENPLALPSPKPSASQVAPPVLQQPVQQNQAPAPRKLYVCSKGSVPVAANYRSGDAPVCVNPTTLKLGTSQLVENPIEVRN